MSENPQAFIQIRGISKHFGDVIAVNKVDLDIKKGELFSILGASGSGKTTLLRMMAGLEIPTEGKIFIDGIDMTNVPPYKRPVNIMFQSYALFPHMTVFDNIAYGLRKEGITKVKIDDKVRKMLALVKLSDYGKRTPNQLSGGQSQRVALARSLIKEPKVLLLDEPLAALDKKLRQSTQFELMDIHEELGVTFVIVTHDQEEAMTLSDRIAVMEEGEFVQIGTPNSIYEHPNSKFVADFIGNINMFDAKVISSGEQGLNITCKALGGDIVMKNSSQTIHATDLSVALRPEKVIIDKQQPSNENIDYVSGVVEDFGYFGNLSIFRVRTTNGDIIQVSKQNRVRIEDTITWEDQVYLSWEPESLIVLDK